MAADDRLYELKAVSINGDTEVMENDVDVQTAQLKATNKFLSEASAELVALISSANSLTK